jgi:hypothetical protein
LGEQKTYWFLRGAARKRAAVRGRIPIGEGSERPFTGLSGIGTVWFFLMGRGIRDILDGRTA